MAAGEYRLVADHGLIVSDDTDVTPPKVSVLMFAYNLAPFVRQAVESVIEQRATFSYEILIGDDCSTDGTREILIAYQRSHPERIRLILPEHRLGRGGVPLFAEVFRQARGEFLAYCDCDDYWLSPAKLARQVSFLEAHPECAICFHDCVVVGGDGLRDPINYTPTHIGRFSTIEDLWIQNFIASCSAVLRHAALPDLPSWYRQVRWGDWARYLLAARHGSIGYLPEEMGAYRSRPDGEWSGLTRVQQLESCIEFVRDMNARLENKFSRDASRTIARLQVELSDALWSESSS